MIIKFWGSIIYSTLCVGWFASGDQFVRTFHQVPWPLAAAACIAIIINSCYYKICFIISSNVDVEEKDIQYRRKLHHFRQNNNNKDKMMKNNRQGVERRFSLMTKSRRKSGTQK